MVSLPLVGALLRFLPMLSQEVRVWSGVLNSSFMSVIAREVFTDALQESSECFHDVHPRFTAQREGGTPSNDAPGARTSPGALVESLSSRDVGGPRPLLRRLDHTRSWGFCPLTIGLTASTFQGGDARIHLIKQMRDAVSWRAELCSRSAVSQC